MGETVGVAHDLVIRGGTVVDGTGVAPFAADVAVDGGRVTAVGRLDDTTAAEETAPPDTRGSR